VKKASGAHYSIINPNSFLFTLIIIFILVFGAASIVAYKHYESELLYAIAENKSTANLLSALIYEHQKAAIGVLESYAQRPLFIDAIQKRDFHHVLYHLKSLNEHHTEIDALFLADQYGTSLANYPVSRETYGKNFAYRDWYKGVSKKWSPYISTVYRRLVLEKDPVVAVCVPVFDRKGKVIGILASSQRTFFLATFIRANRLNPRKNITFLDQEGNIIYGDNVDYQKEITKYLHFSPIQGAIRNGKNILEIPDPVRGRKEELLAFSPVRDMGWTVIVSEDKGAILRSETTHFIQVFAIAFFLFVCMIIAPLLLRRDYQYREAKELLTQEKKLRESEVRYRNLVESISDVVYTIDSSGVLTYISPVVKNTLGYEPDELIGRQFLEFVHKEDQDLLMRRLSELSEGIVKHSDYRVIGKHGDIKWVRTLTNPIIEEGGFVGARGVLIDITERKQAEEALIKSELRFRNCFDLPLIGFAITSPEKGWIEVNDRICSILGYSRDEIVQRTWSELTHPDDLAADIEQFNLILSGQIEKYSMDKRFIRKDGQVVWTSISVGCVRKPDGGVNYIIGLMEDITERKRAEEALKQSEEKYRTILENIEEGYYEVDIAGNFTFLNDSMYRIFGYPKEELIGMNDRQYTNQENAKRLFQAYNKVYRTGIPDRGYEYEIIRKDGTKRYVEVSIALQKDSSGKTIGFKGIAQDITERKRAEEERERFLAEIAAKNQELESFVYTISHDLRAPLVSLDGFSSLLKRESQNQLGEQGQHYLERIRANVAHMNTLVTELLDLSRIGRVVGPEEEIDVGVLLREIEEGLVLKLEQEGVEFIVQQPLPAVRGDRGRIRQVFANLIENAVKFRSLERRVRIEVGCEEEKGFYRFHVGDNGIGISPQYQEQIFEPFRQLDSGIEGVGIGLAIVKKIVEHHGGRVWVESEAGKGSTFYFTIPDRT